MMENSLASWFQVLPQWFCFTSVEWIRWFSKWVYGRVWVGSHMHMEYIHASTSVTFLHFLADANTKYTKYTRKCTFVRHCLIILLEKLHKVHISARSWLVDINYLPIYWYLHLQQLKKDNVLWVLTLHSLFTNFSFGSVTKTTSSCLSKQSWTERMR